MYEWYARARVCFVHLSDIDIEPHDLNATKDSMYLHLATSTWFTRGWTLQELLAPKLVVFCNATWQVFGHISAYDIAIDYGQNITHEVHLITGIPLDILNRKRSLNDMSIAQRMSWAADRTTTRVEDEAYCLLGIFGVNMPLLYGEGRKAFLRLQEEIIRHSTDMSILAWSANLEMRSSASRLSDRRQVLADSPEEFRKVNHATERCNIFLKPYTITNNGLELNSKLYKSEKLPTKRILALNYVRNNKHVFIPLENVLLNIYERGFWNYHEHSSLRDLHWTVSGDETIYLLTGLEDGTKIPGHEGYHTTEPPFSADGRGSNILLL